MSATDEQIERVRRMTGELDTGTYIDDDIQTFIEDHPLVDENGEPPRVPSTTTPGEMMTNPDWTDTYDLNHAAADIWEEKAAVLAGDYDFEADGGKYTRSQAYEQAMKMARHYRAKRSPKEITLVPDLSRERTYETNRA